MLSTKQETEAPRLAADVEAEEGDRARLHSPRSGSVHPSGDMTLARVASTLLERIWTLLAVVVATLALAAIYLLVAPPVYESSVLLQVESRSRSVPAFQDLSAFVDPATPTEGEMRIMKSRTLLDAVIDQLGLDVVARPRFFPVLGAALSRRYEGPAPAPAPLGLGRFAWGGERIVVRRLVVPEKRMGDSLRLTVLDGGRYRLTASDGTPLVQGEVGKIAGSTGADRDVELLVSDLTARPGTEFALTKLRHMDVVERLQANLVISQQGKDTGLVLVTLSGKDPVRVAAVLDAVAAEYLRQNVERTTAEAANTLRVLQAHLPVLKANVDKAETALNAFRRTNGTVNLSIETQAMIARIGEMDRSIAENELRVTELAQRYTPQHSDVAALTERMRQLRSQRDALEARMRSLPDLELQSARLSRQIMVATELYMSVLNRAEELQIVKSGWIGSIRVLEQAVVPYRPSSPKRALVLVLSAVLGLSLGIGAALVREAFDEGAKDPHEIENGTGLPVIASVRQSAAQRRLFHRNRRGRLPALSVAEPGDAVVEDLRGLRTSVQFALLRAHSKVVAVGGLSPGAGKTFVSVNLAHLFAASGGRVLLVDGDLRSGLLHRHFDQDPKPGLADVLSGTAQLDGAIRRTDTPQLDVLPVGELPKSPAELLAGPAFQRLLDELGKKYDVVIVDTPPFLSVADFALVGRHAGLNVLVLREGESSTSEIAFALRRLAQNGVAVKGAILNHVRPALGRYGRLGRYSGRYADRRERGGSEPAAVPPA